MNIRQQLAVAFGADDDVRGDDSMRSGYTEINSRRAWQNMLQGLNSCYQSKVAAHLSIKDCHRIAKLELTHWQHGWVIQRFVQQSLQVAADGKQPDQNV